MAPSIQYVSPFERALYLKRVAPLNDLTPDHLAVVAQQAEERWYTRGAVIQARSDPVRSFHIVVAGRVHAQGGEHGDEMLGPEKTLGLLSLFARAAEGLEAVADFETRTLEIHSDDLDEVLEDHFSILYNEIRDIACRSLRARMDIETGTHLEPRQRLKRPPARELDLVERLQLLRSGPIFRNANMDALLGLANRLKEARFVAGETLWEADDASGYMYAIVDGRVRCTLPDGRWFTAGTGYPLGNLESQCGASRWYRAVTETPVVALRSSTDEFIDMLEDHFETAREFLAAMASGLIQLLRQA